VNYFSTISYYNLKTYAFKCQIGIGINSNDNEVRLVCIADKS